MNEEVRHQPKEKQLMEEMRFQEVEGEGWSKESEDSSPPAAPPMPSSISMVIALGIIAMLSGFLVVLIYEYTAPIIAEKERLALEAAVFQVIPSVVDTEAVQRADFLITADELMKLDEESEGKANLYAVYSSLGDLLGFAMEGVAQGYQDVVRTLFGYDPNCECIVGMMVLKSTDTPGLGDKATVEKNKEFMANFQSLDVSLTSDRSAVEHPVDTVKHGSKTKAWQVDAMAGATITSRAIANGIRDAVGELLPLLMKHLVAIRSFDDNVKVEN
uniref:Ion-translocating oxidoreductase complex subunit G n=1 Tax=Candidatus Kentrum sp. LFY TaxID=2126342 RepID=A0A450UUU2_9GAMM|nr:MAG: electron transport complex protein RnfG [Candidatus Kentron sp. LFY]